MIAGIVDTTIIIHLFRARQTARAWFGALDTPLGVTSITWLEVIYGAPGHRGLEACKTWLDKFEMIRLLPEDQDWAMDQLFQLRLSHGAEINDCLIAAVCHRLQIPIFTHNIRDMRKYLPEALVITPYQV